MRLKAGWSTAVAGTCQRLRSTWVMWKSSAHERSLRNVFQMIQHNGRLRPSVKWRRTLRPLRTWWLLGTALQKWQHCMPWQSCTTSRTQRPSSSRQGLVVWNCNKRFAWLKRSCPQLCLPSGTMIFDCSRSIDDCRCSVIFAQPLCWMQLVQRGGYLYRTGGIRNPSGAMWTCANADAIAIQCCSVSRICCTCWATLWACSASQWYVWK